MGSPGKVLILVENLTVPFDRRVWLESRALRDAGWHVSVICPEGPPHVLRYENLEGVHIYRYPAPPPTRGLGSYLREFLHCWLWTFRLAFRVRREQGFDVLHACNPPDTFFLIGWWWRVAGVKFVFDQHDLCPEVYLSRFGARRGFLYRALLLLERLTYASSDLVIATNQSYRQVARSRGRVDDRRAAVVRSAPDLSRFQQVDPCPELRRGRRHLVCYLGVMAPQDGVDYLLRAVHHVVRERRREDIHFSLIGSGDSFEDLRRLAAELGIGPWVEFTGRIPDADVMRYLSTCDLGAAPDPRNPLNDLSTMNKVLEYMATGRALVAFDLKETRFSAGDGALYAAPNREDDFGDRMLELLDDPERRAAMGARNARRLREELAWDKSAAALVEAYAGLGRRGGRG
ncbi:MAG TPA: glycosyltransferase family 4 protein [Candidatus Saccharimonadales bacterium]|nr:glycosyltransferase family 4 protein [Candidatus Saccharimonadales bacterium]